MTELRLKSKSWYYFDWVGGHILNHFLIFTLKSIMKEANTAYECVLLGQFLHFDYASFLPLAALELGSPFLFLKHRVDLICMPGDEFFSGSEHVTADLPHHVKISIKNGTHSTFPQANTAS